MEQIKYTEEILKKDLMNYMGYSESRAEQLIISYSCMCEIEDLAAAVEEKKKSCMRL